MKVIGYRYLDRSAHLHDCKKCEYQFGVQVFIDNKPSKNIADVYLSCDNSTGETPYLIRYSDRCSDYSTCGLKQLAAHYMTDCLGLNR